MELLQGEGGDSASTTEERAAAMRQRQERIAQLRAGAAPRAAQTARALSPSRISITQEQIRDMFDFYANFGRTTAMSYQEKMDSFMFMKFVKECPGLLDDAVNRTEVDLIFTKAKPKFERRLDFEHFLDALAAIAERKFPDYAPADGLRLLITSHLSPHYEVYQRECAKTGESEVPLRGVYKKLYDHRSYTGVYAERFRSADGRINGEADNRPGRVFSGSTNQGTDETIHDISVLMRPNLRAGGTMMAPANHTLVKRGLLSPRAASPSAARLGATRSASRARSASRPASAAGSMYGSGDGRSEAGGGGRGAPPFASPIRAAGGPAPAPTPASAARPPPMPDHAALAAALERARAGEPTELMALTSQLVAARAGGSPLRANAGAANAPRPATAPASADKSEVSRAGRSTLGGGGGGGGGGAPATTSGTLLTQEQIRDVFDFYANFGRTQVMSYQETLDSFMFMKFVKECPGLLDDSVTRTEADLIFTKAKPKFERRLHFSHFLDALAAIAERKFPDYAPADGLRLLILNHLSPHWDLVQAECAKTGESEVPLSGVYKKLYDVRSYTGVYAERFRSMDGRINGEADNRPGRVFTGSTNLGTDETIHDISVLMRPNLRSGSMMAHRPVAEGA